MLVNNKIKRKGFYERITIVCYYRKKMIYCGNFEYELNRAKKNIKKVFTEEEILRVKKIKGEANEI